MKKRLFYIIICLGIISGCSGPGEETEVKVGNPDAPPTDEQEKND